MPQAGFFDDVDSTGIVENHIKEVLRLEHDQAQSVLDSYSSIRQDLVDRLSKAPVNKFTAQHLRGVLAQVDGAIIALNESLQGGMVEGAYQAALTGVSHLLKELSGFDKQFIGAVTPINLRAAVVARDTSNLMIEKYKTSMETYGQSMRQIISQNLLSAAIGATNYSQVVGDISKFFVGEEWRLHRVVRTELHHIYNIGKINGMRELTDDVPDLMKTLMHPMDARTGLDSQYAAKLALVAVLDEPFKYEWKGKTREFQAPPDRPNDRAILVPYREEWGKAKGPAWIPAKFPAA
jgi:hypothetical protein